MLRIADDHAAIAARLRELEAERRGDAPLWFAVDVARPGSDVTVVSLPPRPASGGLWAEMRRQMQREIDQRTGVRPEMLRQRAEGVGC